MLAYITLIKLINDNILYKISNNKSSQFPFLSFFTYIVEIMLHVFHIQYNNIVIYQCLCILAF
jgi:hypothetical protein